MPGTRRNGECSGRTTAANRIAFQIADDVLDIWGDEQASGKSLGTDLLKQKLRFPIIHLLSVASPSTNKWVRAQLAEARPEGRRSLRPELEQSGALDYAWDRAGHFAARALTHLEVLDESPAKSILCSLGYYLVTVQRQTKPVIVERNCGSSGSCAVAVHRVGLLFAKGLETINRQVPLP